MAERRVERRLAAILCADVAGYSRLVGADEEGMIAALKAHRRGLIDPMLAAHQGRIVKTSGDFILIEFPSAVDVKQVGRELGVRHVLEGSVRKAVNRVRGVASLVYAEDVRNRLLAALVAAGLPE
ncbi:MAG TPA: hypothetical protein VMU87_04925 [Stellaceae bacterium]|nr:hypothetical protein [Stellaceae bacterium]